MTENIQDTLNERGKRYGPFVNNGLYAQKLKDICKDTPGWQLMAPYQREALEMVLHKVARILNGDPHYDDSWRDIAGYSQLVVDELNRK